MNTSPLDIAFQEYLNQQNATFKSLHAKYPKLIRPVFDSTWNELFGNLVKQLQSSTFLRIKTPSNSTEWLFHAGLIWNPVDTTGGYDVNNAIAKIKQLPAVVGQYVWRLATASELNNFAWINGNPWRNGSNGRLFQGYAWLSSNGRLDLDYNRTSADSGNGCLIAVNPAFKNDLVGFISHALKNNWKIFALGDTKNKNLLANCNTTLKLNFSECFKFIDEFCAKLPRLESADFTDPNKGLWEFWGMDAAELKELGLRARDPAQDVQQGAVAIDFGTSSTVVAYENNGVGKLLRIGVTNFLEAPQPAHYENPTVLEMVDLPALLKPWKTTAYRPDVMWNDVRCSDEALHNFRHNETDPKIVASILTKMKQWALREGTGNRLRLTDQTHGTEMELPALTLRQPVKGQALMVCDQDPFDPVELYAWFLGLTINWRRTGIFLRYYMTFPVDYPREVKDKILASFSRGLQRSLPATLIAQPDVFGQFTVEERASEPAAYAAAAMPALGIEPTDKGVAYAVFDFGGGTTDFDFGYYRWPVETEERNGIEQVFEHFGSGGDKFLGGENLLEHLAYRTFCHNIEVCRTKKVAFTKPLDAADFSGSEMFLERTQAAATNSLMLVSKLRKFWETGEEGNSTGVERIDLLDREGKKVQCEFTIPYPALREFLQARIEEGVRNFFTTLKAAFGEEMPAEVNVLLAGNAARSEIVLGLFGLLAEDDDLYEITKTILGDVFDGEWPEFTAYSPLEADANDVNRPTGKTGVALGLLALCPGSSTLVVNHAKQKASGDAPFQHFVGRIRRDKFYVSVHQGNAYQTWVELGPVGLDRVFKLFHTQAARALGGDMPRGDAALRMKTLHFAGNTEGCQVFACPIKPHEIQICTAESLKTAQAGQGQNIQIWKLEE